VVARLVCGLATGKYQQKFFCSSDVGALERLGFVGEERERALSLSTGGVMIVFLPSMISRVKPAPAQHNWILNFQHVQFGMCDNSKGTGSVWRKGYREGK